MRELFVADRIRGSLAGSACRRPKIKALGNVDVQDGNSNRERRGTASGNLFDQESVMPHPDSPHICLFTLR